LSGSALIDRLDLFRGPTHHRVSARAGEETSVMRWIRRLATGIGGLFLLLFVVSLAVLALRWLQVVFFYAPEGGERAEQKQIYLDTIDPVDRDRAPNFIVVLFDDLGWGDLSSYGSRLIRTPRIDSIAAAGLRMTDFYSASPVCTPSRAALLTGRYPVRSLTHNHVFFSETSPIATARKMLGVGNELPRDEILLPEVLAAAGYATGMIGKWHLGDIEGHLPNDFGFEDYYGVRTSNDMQPLHVYRNAEIEIEDQTERINLGAFRDEDSDIEMKGVDQRQLTRRYTEEAIRFVEKNRDRPFFLYLAHTSPHVPHFADPEHEGASPGGLYGDVVEDLDRSTGALLDALERLDLEGETLVLITSDNGADYNGSPGFLRGRKGEVYEGGQRVPMIAYWPGRVGPGRVSDTMAMNIDLFPTLLSLAGVGPPQDRVIDGRDLTPFLTSDGDEQGPHDFLFYFPVVRGSAPAAVRSAEFKYLASTGDTGRDKAILSDVHLDQENHNLIRRFPKEGARLAAALEEFRVELRGNPRGWR
jgi:arylsulfatase A-like enzyme